LLYSCEVWGESFFQKEFKSKIERFHLAMCKQILGVNKRAKNVGTLSEFGRYPFYTNIQTQIFKYFQRFVFVDKDTLLYKSFQEECLNDFAFNKRWVPSIKSVLNNLGMTNLWKNIFSFCKSKDASGTYCNKTLSFKKRIRDIYLQVHVLNKRNKYGTCDLNVREDEFHFLIKCPKYERMRNTTFTAIRSNENLSFNKMSDVELLFDNASLHTLNILGNFLRSCFEEKENKIDTYIYYIVF